MIERVLFNNSPIYPGETRPLTAFSNLPLFVEVKCFTDTPPPPGYKACASCGVINARRGEEVEITADPVALQSGGRLDVIVRDQSGDERIFKLTVRTRQTGAAGGLAAGG